MDHRTRPPAAPLALAVILAVLASLYPSGARASGAGEPSPLPAPGAGELYRRTTAGFAPLPVLDLAVHLDVTGLMVHGTVVQIFQNTTGEVIEALYAFPLPEAAAVHHMEMAIGTRRIVSVIRERHEARRTYEAARAEGRKTALVEQERPNLFTTSVAGINPGESVIVTLEFVQEAEYQDGEFGLSFPLTYTPRFDPGPGLGGTPGLREGGRLRVVPRAALGVRLDAGFELESAGSPSHELERRWDGGALVLETPAAGIAADRDVLLRWRPRLGEAPASALFTETREGESYHLVMVLPPAPEVDAGLASETIFVVDVSGSMDGPSIAQAREALLSALGRLRPDDSFNIVAFNDGLRPFQERLVPAREEELAAARHWIRGLRAGGGTRIHPALQAGLQMLQGGRTWTGQRIILLTDGAVANEAELIQAILPRLGGVRLHTLGIGHAPNRFLMRKMAAVGRGLCAFISGAGDAGRPMEEFLERLSRPGLAEIDLRWEGSGQASVFPQRLPDLHAGEPLWISLRTAGPGQVTLTGQRADGPWRVELPLGESAPRDAGVALRWARAQVEALMDSLLEGAGEDDVRRQVTGLGIDFHLVTRYTSLVAVERFPSAAGEARTARLAGALPAGSPMGVLPRGGTQDTLLLICGCALLLSGALLLAGASLVTGRRRNAPRPQRHGP